MSELKLRPPVGSTLYVGAKAPTPSWDTRPVFSWARKLRRGWGGDSSGRGAALRMTRCTGEYAWLKPGATEAAQRDSFRPFSRNVQEDGSESWIDRHTLR